MLQVGPYDNTKRAPVKGSTLGYWEAEEGFKAADHMRQHPSQHQLPPLQDRKHPSRDVGVAAEDKAEGLVQETSVADSSTVQEDDVGYADVQGDGVSVAEDVDIPSLQLGESSNQVGAFVCCM